MNKKQKENGVWKFANSNFGLWFLSTIFISSLTFGYSLWNDYQKRQIEISEKIQRLDNEINFRLQSYNLTYILWEAMSRVPTVEVETEMINPFKLIINPPTSDNFFYADFKQRNLVSLLIELESLESDISKKSKLKSAINKVLFLRNTVCHEDSLTIKEYYEYDDVIDTIVSLRWSYWLNEYLNAQDKTKNSLKNVN